MLYCERCSTLYPEDGACPFCRKHLGRKPVAEDVCFFTEQGFVWAEILQDMLKQDGIPFVRKQAVGVASLVGENLARYRFYTLYSRYDEAVALVQELEQP